MKNQGCVSEMFLERHLAAKGGAHPLSLGPRATFFGNHLATIFDKKSKKHAKIDTEKEWKIDEKKSKMMPKWMPNRRFFIFFVILRFWSFHSLTDLFFQLWVSKSIKLQEIFVLTQYRVQLWPQSVLSVFLGFRGVSVCADWMMVVCNEWM